MKKSTILIGALAAAITVPALAADGVLKDAYVSAKIGATITDLDPNHLNYNSDANYSSYPTSGSVFGMSNSQKTLASGAVAFGWNLEPSLHVPVRTELEYSVQEGHKFVSKTAIYFDPYYLKDTVKLQQQSVMWNTYFDWKNTTKFTPYFAVGVGATRIHTKGTLSDNSVSGTFSEDFAATSKTDFNFIWSVGVGTSYSITPNLAADLSYKYIDSGKLKLNYSSSNGPYTGTQESSYDLRAHNFALGLRYSF
ncbi:outer membrane protein [Acinetobacter brisouii]|uniref:outer membrane protein n=1 Tax=Acinetobacter brisouii TaxID=396323 RepID=UPI0035B3D1D8